MKPWSLLFNGFCVLAASVVLFVVAAAYQITVVKWFQNTALESPTEFGKNFDDLQFHSVVVQSISGGAAILFLISVGFILAGLIRLSWEKSKAEQSEAVHRNTTS
jgi:hypothetical protein